MAQDLTQNLGLLKAIVIGLGVAILLCIAIMVAYLIAQVTKGSPDTPAAVLASLPRGAQIVDTQATGDLLVVRVKTDQGEQVMTFDLASGRQKATISFVPAP